MKRIFLSLVAILLLTATLLSSCAPAINIPAEEETLTQTETNPATKEIVETAQQIVNQADPANDKVLNVLIIGNSFSTGWPDELNGLLKAAGIRAQIFSVYYSGCPLVSHWHWLQTDKKNYRLRHHEQDGGTSDDHDVGLDFCLRQRNWDVISLQQHFSPSKAVSYDEALKSCTPYAENLYNYIREKYPKSTLVWHETWAYEVKKADLTNDFRHGAEPFKQTQSVPDVETQTLCYENMRKVSVKLAEDNKVPMIPCGDAWQIARANPLIGDTMTRDGYHDGPVGGGQYLNACVWFEMLTGQSCIGNTWRPKYALTEERLIELQKAAHQAVEENPVKERVVK
ncbi:MAG: DUF4886 domain-containing protein [Clostridia bacterium]|nr:DUF4886 domain-containing protein [Clostridia bacterium]